MRTAASAGAGTRGGPASEGEAPTPPITVPRLALTWPAALVVCGVLLAVAGGRAAAFAVVLLGCTWLAAARAVANAAGGLGLHYRVLDTHVLPGTHAHVEVTVANRSRWPIPFVALEARITEGLHGQFRRFLALGPGAVRRFRFELTGLERGAYRLGDTRVVLSDWLGLCEERAEVPARTRLVVYPRLPELPATPQERRLPAGPRRDPSSPFYDEIPAGVRPYVPGDPLRAIAWKQSAHRGELVVREYPHVREAATWVFLDLCAGDWDALTRRELTELAVAVAARLIWEECRSGHAVGLGAWGALVERGFHREETVAPAGWHRLPPAPGHAGPLHALEVLATIRTAESGRTPDFAAHLRRELAQLTWGTRALVLVPRDTPELWRVSAEARAHGHPVTLLCLERRLGRPGDLSGPHVPEVVEVRVDDAIRFR